MNVERRTSGTTAPAYPGVFGALVFDRRVMPAVVISALLTTSGPSMAATKRFEDTASRSRPQLLMAEELASVKRILSLADYEAGWDGPGSIGPTVETVKQAIAFARQLHTLGQIAHPHISLAGDGEINFYWKTPHLVLDLGFTGTGRFSYFGTTPEGVEFIEDEAELGQPLPPELIASLQA